MNITELDARVAELTELRKSLVEAANAEAKTALTAIPREFDWRVTWRDEYTLTIECKMTDETETAIRAWKATYPTSTIPMPEFRWHGMEHILVDNVLVPSGGGSIILTLERDYSRRYHVLTQAQADSLRACIVPEELRKPW